MDKIDIINKAFASPLLEKELLYLSNEAMVPDPRFHPLFSSEDLNQTRQRLEYLGYSAAGKKEVE